MAGVAVLFSGRISATAATLWSTDGTPEGTTQLAVAEASVLGFNPHDLIVLGAKVLFGGIDSLGKARLWVSDGSGAGTSVVPVVGASVESGLKATGLAVAGNKAVFYGINSANVQGLWASDGTGAGTSEIAVSGAYLVGSTPSNITAFGTQVLFSARAELAAGGRMLAVADLATGIGSVLAVQGAAAAGLNPKFITRLGSVALFQGTNSTGQSGLWVTDGTAAGTVELSVEGSSSTVFEPSFAIAFGDKVLFNGRDSLNRPSLWVTDATAAGTVKLAVAGAFVGGLSPGPFVAFDGKVYFSGVDAAGDRGVWSTDGTAAGTAELAVSNAYAGAPGLAGGVNPTNFAAVGNMLLFEGINADGKLGLWKSDGTTSGTVEIPVTGAAASGLAPSALAVLDPGVGGAPCFAAGTRLRTVAGEVEVERLRVGDRVMTASGTAAEVVWLGHRRVACAGHRRPHDVWPVRVAAGAFAFGQPARALWLSPDHAVFVDGALIPVRYLLNGATIVQEPREAVEYWHVELARHDVILAEGLPAESYLDTGNRDAFANGGPVAQMAPVFARTVWTRDACAPLLWTGAALGMARLRLLARARVLGHRLVTDAGLVAVVNGREVAPQASGREMRLRLPAGTRSVTLRSRSAVPAEIRRDDPDHRRLGVFVQGLWLDGRKVELGDARLTSGWHAVEQGGTVRWTDGAGRIESPAPLRSLTVVTAPLMSYWADEVPTGRAALR